jgi:hypothetical protein
MDKPKKDNYDYKEEDGYLEDIDAYEDEVDPDEARENDFDMNDEDSDDEE